MKRNRLEILTIMLSWNRPHLLEKTIHSYFHTVSVSHRLIVVDNASDEQTIFVLRKLAKRYPLKILYLKKNVGGVAFNHALRLVNLHEYRFFHFSENDIEYQLGWDKVLLKKFSTFPKVGQISPYSPFPQIEKGEIWLEKQASLVKSQEQTLYLTDKNVGTTCLVRGELVKKGLRWTNLKAGTIPDDGAFSNLVKQMGWDVAWNDRYLATNLGHNILELKRETEYYVNNAKNKSWLKLEGFKKRLNDFGYQLVQEKDGTFKIEELDSNKHSKSKKQ